VGVSAYVDCRERINTSRCKPQNVIDGTGAIIFWDTRRNIMVFKVKKYNILRNCFTLFGYFVNIILFYVHASHIFITFTAYDRCYRLYFVFAKYSILYSVILCHEWEQHIQIVPFCLHFVYSFIDCQLKRTFNNMFLYTYKPFRIMFEGQSKEWYFLCMKF